MTAECLAQIAAEQGVDFATALLYQRIVDSPDHGSMIAEIDSMPAYAATPCRPDTRVVIVPGAFYRKFKNSGADGQEVRAAAAELGYATDIIPLNEFGALSENAVIIGDWLEGQTDGPIILVSLSKGGSEMKLTLNSPNAKHTFRNVRAWINLSGLLNGSPMASWVFAHRLRTWRYRAILGVQGFDLEYARGLAPGRDGLLDFDLQIPTHMRAVHVLGFPLARHMTTALGRRTHSRLRALGPNDGAILLGDACRTPGFIYPVWGADHYLQAQDGGLRLIALRVLNYLAGEASPATNVIDYRGAQA